MGKLGNVIRGFKKDVVADIDRIHRGAFGQVLADANRSRMDGGLMPIDTGALQDSLCVNGRAGRVAYMEGIALASPNSRMVATWGNAVVNYAVFVEMGTRFQRAQPFARTAVLKWPLYVRNEAAKV